MSGLGAHARRRLCLNRQISQTQGVSLVPPRPVLCDESSKRVQSGEPLEIDVLILYFAGDPNSTLELIRTYCIARGSTQHGFGPSSCQTDSFTIAHHYATTKKPCDRSHFHLPTTPLLLTPERISSRPRWSLQQGFCGVPLPLMFPPEARPRDRLWRRGVQATSRRPALRSPETP